MTYICLCVLLLVVSLRWKSCQENDFFRFKAMPGFVSTLLLTKMLTKIRNAGLLEIKENSIHSDLSRASGLIATEKNYSSMVVVRQLRTSDRYESEITFVLHLTDCKQ